MEKMTRKRALMDHKIKSKPSQALSAYAEIGPLRRCSEDPLLALELIDLVSF